jgi:hypothetical protein
VDFDACQNSRVSRLLGDVPEFRNQLVNVEFDRVVVEHENASFSEGYFGG